MACLLYSAYPVDNWQSIDSPPILNSHRESDFHLPQIFPGTPLHIFNFFADPPRHMFFFHSAPPQDLKWNSPYTDPLWKFSMLKIISKCFEGSYKPKSRHCFTVSPKRKYTLLSSQVLKTEQGQMKCRGAPNSPLSWSKLGQASFWNSKKWLNTNKNREETFCSCVAILWNFKTRLDPIWTNSMVGVVHPLLFL